MYSESLLCTNFSRIFPGCGNSEIGLKLVTMDRSPFLGIGITSASFHELGKKPLVTDKFNMKVSCSIRTFSIDLRTI